MIKKKIIVGVVIIFVFFGFWFLYKTNNAEKTANNNGTTIVGVKKQNDIIPEGVRTELENGEKVIENGSQGYVVKVAEDWFLNGSNGSEKIEVSKTYKEFSPETKINGEIFIAVEMIEANSIEEQIKRYKEKYNLSDSDLVGESEKIRINGLNGYKEEYRLPEGSQNIKNYYFSSGNKLYILISYISSRFPSMDVQKQNEGLMKNIESDLDKIVRSFAVSQ
jgi:hypothetical protein